MIAILLLALSQDPAARAREVALHLPFAHSAFLELRRTAGAISEPALRAAVETQILAPWLPPEAWAFAHLDEARKLLGEPRLELPPPHKATSSPRRAGRARTATTAIPADLRCILWPTCSTRARWRRSTGTSTAQRRATTS